MKLLIISRAFPPFVSPESAHTAFLCEQFSARGVEVHLLTDADIEVPDTPLPYRLYPIIEAWDWRRLPKIARLIRNLQPDAVLLLYIDWIYGFHPAITFLPALTRLMSPRPRFVTLFENVSGVAEATRPKRHWTRDQIRLAARLAAGWFRVDPVYGVLFRDSDHIIALAEGHREVFAQANAAVRDKSVVIPAPCSLKPRLDVPEARAEGRARLGLSVWETDTIALIYFGYIYGGKGVETLLEAAHLIDCDGATQPRSWKLQIVGNKLEETEARLLRLVETLGLQERVIWFGHQADPAASALLSGADIAILPFDAGVRLNNSSFTTCALHGLPIVATRGAKTEPVFEDGRNTALVPPQNPRALADKILQLMQDREMRHQLGQGASKLAATVLSNGAIIDKMLDVLDLDRDQTYSPNSGDVSEGLRKSA